MTKGAATSDDGSGEAPGRAVPASLDRHRPYLHLFARTGLPAALSRKLDASDVVQQTLLRACRGWAGFRGTTDAELAGWLRQLLRNTLIDAIREHAGPTRDAALERSLDATLSSASGAIEDFAATSVGSRAVRAEELARLAAALESLPPDQRTAIELHQLQGLSVNEVAARLDRTEASVAGLLRRGLKALRTTLGEPPP